MTTRPDDLDPKFSYRMLCLGMRRVPAVLGGVPDPKTLTKRRLTALLGIAYVLGADDCAETAAKIGMVKQPSRRAALSNVVPFARRARDPRPL